MLLVFALFILNLRWGVRFSSQTLNHYAAAFAWCLPFGLMVTGLCFGPTWMRWLRGIGFGLMSMLTFFPFLWSVFGGVQTQQLGYDPMFERLSAIEVTPFTVSLFRENTQGALGAFSLEVVQGRALVPGLQHEIRIWSRYRAAEGELLLGDDGAVRVRVCRTSCADQVVHEEPLRLH